MIHTRTWNEVKDSPAAPYVERTSRGWGSLLGLFAAPLGYKNSSRVCSLPSYWSGSVYSTRRLPSIAATPCYSIIDRAADRTVYGRTCQCLQSISQSSRRPSPNEQDSLLQRWYSTSYRERKNMIIFRRLDMKYSIQVNIQLQEPHFVSDRRSRHLSLFHEVLQVLFPSSSSSSSSNELFRVGRFFQAE